MTDQPHSVLLTAFYAMVCSIEDGKIDDGEVQHTLTYPDHEEVITITVNISRQQHPAAEV